MLYMSKRISGLSIALQVTVSNVNIESDASLEL